MYQRGDLNHLCGGSFSGSLISSGQSSCFISFHSIWPDLGPSWYTCASSSQMDFRGVGGGGSLGNWQNLLCVSAPSPPFFDPRGAFLYMWSWGASLWPQEWKIWFSYLFISAELRYSPLLPLTFPPWSVEGKQTPIYFTRQTLAAQSGSPSTFYLTPVLPCVSEEIQETPTPEVPSPHGSRLDLAGER